MQRQRAQGLCFDCNEKFTVRHKCTRAQLLILESEEDPGNIIAEEINQEVEPAEVNEPQITYYALIEWSGPQTI